jgi:hypothetical protein
MHAAHGMFERCVAELLDKGASVKAVDECQRTALHHFATSDGPVDAEAAHACGRIIEMLLDAGIDVHAFCIYSCCALLIFLKSTFETFGCCLIAPK